MATLNLCPVERITDGPFQHFFGYYDKTPWAPDGSAILGLRVLGAEAEVGLVAGADWRPLGRTDAWNWQQGAMAQWLGPSRDVLFNVPEGSAVVSADTGERRALPAAVYAVSPDGSRGLTVDFAGLAATHPTIGVSGAAAAPDGIAALDLASGALEPLVPLAALAALEPHPTMDGAAHWVSHLGFDADGARVAFLHRWSHDAIDEDAWWHRLVTMDAGGGDLAVLETTYGMISHPIWRPDGDILVWSTHGDETAWHVYGDSVETFAAGILTENGHATYGPDGRWLLVDTYPDADRVQTLMLYDTETGTRVDVGRFASAPELGYHDRCDLHPRWNRDGTQVCVDSTHEGPRQLYVVDVSAVTRG